VQACFVSVREFKYICDQGLAPTIVSALAPTTVRGLAPTTD
jgi:hypothetical protein